jgi:hypothetical protein
MKSWKLVAALLCLPLVAGHCGPGGAREEAAARQGREGHADVMPSKEHQVLKKFDGDWEFTSKCMMPGMEEMEGKGTESCRMTYGGFWSDIEAKGMMAGKDWSGRGFCGWDPQKKKYVGVWIDSMTPYVYKFEGERMPRGKTWNFKTQGVDPKTGKETSERMVWEFKDPDHRTMKFFGKDESGKEVQFSEMNYTRKPRDDQVVAQAREERLRISGGALFFRLRSPTASWKAEITP